MQKVFSRVHKNMLHPQPQRTHNASRCVHEARYAHTSIVFIRAQLPKCLLGLWLRLECSFDSLSIDPAHVIYLAEGHNVGSERQSSVMTLRKPIVTWII